MKKVQRQLNNQMQMNYQMQSGMSLIEILIGFTLLTLAISATVTIVFGSQALIIDRDNTLSAQLISKEGIVATNAIVKNGWSSVADSTYGLAFSGGAWQLTGSSDTQSIFTRAVAISSTGTADERKVVSTVTWSAGPLRPQKKVEYTTYVSNWEQVLATGNDTGGGGPGSWSGPTVIGTASVGAGNSVTDVDAVGNVLYLATESATYSNADIHSYNITNPTTPTLMSEIDAGADSLQTIDGSYNYIFGSATGVIPDLKIINNANPANLSLAAEFNVITFVDATKIFRDTNTVYLGVHQTGFNGEFFTIDVTNQTSPVQKDTFETNADINGIYEKAGIAYVATSNDSNEMYILDVSTPTNVTQLGSVNISGNTDGTAVFATSPSRVYLGVGSTLYVLDTTNPASVTTLGTFAAGGTINDMYVAGNTVFLATSNSTKEFEVVNAVTPSAMTLVSSLNFPSSATGIDYQNNTVYVALHAVDGLRIITP